MLENDQIADVDIDRVIGSVLKTDRIGVVLFRGDLGFVGGSALVVEQLALEAPLDIDQIPFGIAQLAIPFQLCPVDGKDGMIGGVKYAPTILSRAEMSFQIILGHLFKAVGISQVDLVVDPGVVHTGSSVLSRADSIGVLYTIKIRLSPIK